jgi:hypothetical protein
MALDKRDLYRFPWSMNDNPIAWLEVTDICNIHCEGCYRQRITGHKSLAEVARYTNAADQARLARQAMAKQVGANNEQSLSNLSTRLDKIGAK